MERNTDKTSRSILVVCDDVWHPAEVIEKGISPFADEGFHFEFVRTAKDILTPEMLMRYSFIICCKSNNVTAGNPAPWFEETVTEVMGAEFRSYVEQGGSFMAVHSGNAFGKDGDGVKEYTEFIGNRFLGHPLRCSIQVKKEKDHPIMEGVKEEFDIRDEHYQIELLAEDLDVFLSSSSKQGGVQPAGYTRSIGAGRVCVLTPGHTLSVWETEEFRKIFRNAMRWCLREV